METTVAHWMREVRETADEILTAVEQNVDAYIELANRYNALRPKLSELESALKSAGGVGEAP